MAAKNSVLADARRSAAAALNSCGMADVGRQWRSAGSVPIGCRSTVAWAASPRTHEPSARRRRGLIHPPWRGTLVCFSPSPSNLLDHLSKLLFEQQEWL